VNTTGSFIDVELPLEALRPEDGTWEIQIGTAYGDGMTFIGWLIGSPGRALSYDKEVP
jgi:hypothetical protein